MKFSSRIRLALFTALCCPAFASAAAAEPTAVITTSMGTIEIRLDPKLAPITVKNFTDYAEKGFYDGTIFHRVIDGFMITGGGFPEDMQQTRCNPSLVNEARGTSSNRRGTIAMARTSQPHSATSQFFINVADNDFLDAKNSRDGWGYAVFGRVVRGMDIVDKIASVKTGSKHFMNDVPVKTVTIQSVKIIR